MTATHGPVGELYEIVFQFDGGLLTVSAFGLADSKSSPEGGVTQPEAHLISEGIAEVRDAIGAKHHRSIARVGVEVIVHKGRAVPARQPELDAFWAVARYQLELCRAFCNLGVSLNKTASERIDEALPRGALHE